MTRIEEAIAAVEGMTVLELADLVKKLEEKFGVSALVAAPAVSPSATAASESAVQEEFEVILASAGEKKIQVLKVLREITGLGLREAKELVDTAPKTIKEKIKKEEAEEIKKKLSAEGAKVEIK